MPDQKPRAHLLAVAMRLFNKHGYHAIGVDRIIAEAGVAKTTLYRHFPSKEDLIIAVLRRFDEASRHDLRAFVEAASDDPEARLLAAFDCLKIWISDPEFHGCPFVSASSEFGVPGGAIAEIAVQHKVLTIAYLEELARAASLADPHDLAQEINLLFDGVLAVCQVLRDPASADRAKATARLLIDAHRPARMAPTARVAPAAPPAT